MGLMSSKTEREKLRPGDHIYTWRSGYSYSHHGIYVGDGKVIHLTRGPGLIIFSNDISQPSNDRVVCCSTEDFLCDGQLHRFEYGVSRFVFLRNRPGTCSLVSSNPPEQVLHRASYLLEHGFGNYHLLSRNCEDFAFYCKTGILGNAMDGGGTSGQIESFVTVFSIITIIPHRFLPASLIGLAVVVCGLFCLIRLIDVRSGMGVYCEVVAVERLDHLGDAHNIRENMNMMEMRSGTRWFLPLSRYLGHSIWAIRCWYWTPESEILVWFKSVASFAISCGLVIDHLDFYGFKQLEYSTTAICLLGHLNWTWGSVSTILLCTGLVLLVYGFATSFIISDGPYRRLKLDKFVAKTILKLVIWHWTPRITILQWIKLALIYKFLLHFLPSRLKNHRLMRRAFFACFVIQSVAFFLGLDYGDYVLRIRKISFL